MEIPAGEFKARCLNLINQVRQTRMEIVVTKRGIPVAKLVPLEECAPKRLFGYLQDSITFIGDVTAPVDDAWEVEGHDRS